MLPTQINVLGETLTLKHGPCFAVEGPNFLEPYAIYVNAQGEQSIAWLDPDNYSKIIQVD